MAQKHECGVDLVPASQAGDGACNSVGPQDFQNIRLLIDIGGKTIEIPLKGNLVVQTAAGGDTAANGGQSAGAGQGAAAAQEQEQDDDQKYMDQMRGWLITVATLFVGIAFQAAIQPPAWVPEDWFGLLLRMRTAGAGEATLATSRLLLSVVCYMLLNASTFTVALVLVVLLLTMKKASPTRAITLIAPSAFLIALSVFGTFVLGISNDPRAFAMILIGVIICTTTSILLMRFIWLRMPRALLALFARISGHREQLPVS